LRVPNAKRKKVNKHDVFDPAREENKERPISERVLFVVFQTLGR
jgi:hypothetical protein